jgi:hypothetical protein
VHVRNKIEELYKKKNYGLVVVQLRKDVIILFLENHLH